MQHSCNWFNNHHIHRTIASAKIANTNFVARSFRTRATLQSNVFQYIFRLHPISVCVWVTARKRVCVRLLYLSVTFRLTESSFSKLPNCMCNRHIDWCNERHVDFFVASVARHGKIQNILQFYDMSKFTCNIRWTRYFNTRPTWTSHQTFRYEWKQKRAKASMEHVIRTLFRIISISVVNTNGKCI